MAQRQRKPDVPDPRRASVVICIPVREQVSSFFAYDLARLTGYTGAVLMGKGVTSLQLIMGEGTLIAPQRCHMAAKAVETGATHILWLDSDMRFPKNTLEVLLAHKRDMVGANYVSRMHPYNFVAKKTIGPETPLVTFDNSEGLEQVEAIGFGVVLTRTDLFRGMAEPWFDIPFVPGEDNGFQGEDVGFCTRVRLRGKHVFVDHDLSHYVQHIGQMAFSYMHGLDALEHHRRTEEGLKDGADNRLRNASDGDR